MYLGKRDFVDHLDHVDPVGESGLPDVVCVGVGGGWFEDLQVCEARCKWRLVCRISRMTVLTQRSDFLLADRWSDPR